MPVYEYRCNGCRRKTSLFFRSFSHVTTPTCAHCHSQDLTQLISRMAIVRSHSRRILDIDADRALSGLDTRDKGSIIRWAKRVGREYDGEMGSQFREMAERVESGENHFGLTVDPDFTFRHKLAEEQARAQGFDVQASDPWRKSPSAPTDDYSPPSEV